MVATSLLATICEMADRYEALIETAVPIGPAWLIGYSGGGAVGFEVVSRMEAKGRKDLYLAMLDSNCPAKEPKVKWYRRIFDPKTWEPARVAWEIKSAYRRLRGHRTRRKEQRDYEAAIAAGGELPRWVLARRMAITFNRAYRAYQPGSIESDILLFRATQQSPKSKRAGKTLGWAR